MVDLNSLAIFAKVVETRSFSEAARRLNMPISTVSRRVAELEDQLGVGLLERSTRSLRLTDTDDDTIQLDTEQRGDHSLGTNEEQNMPGNPRDITTSAERRFPVRIRVGVPPDGFGRRYMQMTAWLDENCGADGWALTSSGMRGVVNDAVSIYFLDATLASAFVARWCAGYKVESAEGVFRVRSDEPLPRVEAGLHRTP